MSIPGEVVTCAVPPQAAVEQPPLAVRVEDAMLRLRGSAQTLANNVAAHRQELTSFALDLIGGSVLADAVQSIPELPAEHPQLDGDDLITAVLRMVDGVCDELMIARRELQSGRDLLQHLHMKVFGHGATVPDQAQGR